jgi:hypothetical protein
MIKKILIGILALLVIAQFIPMQKNTSGDDTYHASKKFPMSSELTAIMKDACNDCHTNSTVYPSYTNIQPVGFWLNHHVNEGKQHVNYSEFTNKKVALQYHKLEETIEMVKEGEMPLSSYTYFGLHPKAKLTQEQKNSIVTWAQQAMDTLKAHYPADSLVLKRKGGTH